MKFFAGPWVGEFGWEVMMWQGYVRSEVLKNKYEEVIIIGRASSKYLYHDILSQYIPLDIEGNTTCDLCNGKNYDFMTESFGVGTYFKPQRFLTLPYHDSMRNVQHEYPIRYEWPFSRQTFIKYGTASIGVDILIHLRWTNKCGSSNRNWPVEKWIRLVELLSNKNLSVACIGKPGYSRFIPGTVNKMGIDLESLSNLMVSSKVLVGPSSGPMHFGSLCGIPHVVITPEDNRIRYETAWNPFNTKNSLVINENWNPEVVEVYNSIMLQLCAKN
jgi:hypothetical protein